MVTIEDAAEMTSRFYDSLLGLETLRSVQDVPSGQVHFLDKLLCWGDTVLDQGCGTGSMQTVFAKYGWNTVGVDVSARAIEMAQIHFAPGVFHHGSIHHMPFLDDASISAVWSCCVMEFIPTDALDLVIAETCRVLQDDGWWVLISKYPKPGAVEGVVTRAEMETYEAFKHPAEWIRLIKEAGFVRQFTFDDIGDGCFCLFFQKS